MTAERVRAEALFFRVFPLFKQGNDKAVVDAMLAYAAECVAAERARCAEICRELVERPAGYGGRFEGYGRFMGERTGSECADAIERGE